MLAYLVPVCKLEPDMPGISARTHSQGVTCRMICCSPDIFLYSINSLHLKRLNCILKNTQQLVNKKWMLHDDLQRALPLPLSRARAHAFPLEAGEVGFWTWPGVRASGGPPVALTHIPMGTVVLLPKRFCKEQSWKETGIGIL